MGIEDIKKYIISFFVDKDFIRGTGGTAMAIIFPYLDYLKDILQLSGASLGLVMLYFSIKHKILEIRALQKKSKEK